MHPMLCLCDQLVERMEKLGASEDEIVEALVREHDCLDLLAQLEEAEVRVDRAKAHIEAADASGSRDPPPPRHGLLVRVFDAIPTNYSPTKALEAMRAHHRAGNETVVRLLAMQTACQGHTRYEDRVRALEAVYEDVLLPWF